MIKLLRKIRHRIIAKNRFSHYLLYAIGEIVLVVIGILIALQVNTWNQNRLDTSEEKQLLQAIQVKMNHNKFQVETGFERYIQVVNSSKRLIVLSTRELTPDMRDEVNAHLHNLSKRFLVGNSNQTSIYDEMIGSGKLNLLKSKELRSELTSLKANMELLASYENLQVNFVDNHLSPFLNNNSDRLTITVNGYRSDTSFYDKIFAESFSDLKFPNYSSSNSSVLRDSVFINILTDLIYHTTALLPIYNRINENILTIESLVSE